MADVFISYARPDQERIDQLAAALASEGLDVWWDRNLAGGAEFSTELEAQLDAARTVVVAWSRASVQSNWVADEATEGRDRGVLVPIVLDDVRPKIGFRQFQTLQFKSWKGDRAAPEYRELLGVLKAKLGDDSGARARAVPRQMPTHRPKKPWIIGAVAFAAAVVAAFLATRFGTDERASTQPGAVDEQVAEAAVEPPAQSIAILPFSDMSAEGDQSYFSQGVAEEILNVLARVDGLKVASRRSSFGFGSRDAQDSQTIAEKLSVRHLLDGSVRKAGDTIRVTVRLVDGPRDQTLWSRSFDQVLTVENVLSIQDDIATAGVEELGGKIGVGSADTLRYAAAAATDDLNAYEVFLEGRDLFSRRQTDNLPAIVAKFEEAVRLDPDFSRGWEALAAAYSVSPGWGLVDRPYATLAVEAANRALALRADLALAHAVLGANATYGGAPDYLRSIEFYSRAIELDPGDPTLWSWRGQELAELGFFDDAERDLRRALELDPADAVSQLWLARTQFYAGQLEAATRSFLALDEEMRSAAHLRPLALSLAAEGRDALLEELRSASAGPALEPAFTTDLVVDREFDFESGYAAFRQMLETSYGYGADLPALGAGLHSYKRFAELQPASRTSGQTVWWFRYHEDFLSSPHRYRLIREMGIERYWRERGFPPQCRVLDDDKIECR